MDGERRYRAGDAIDDLCRACKTDRRHSVMVTDGGGRPLRVVCDYCGSLHNCRGGGRSHPAAAPRPAGGPAPAASVAEPFPLVSERERSHEIMSDPESPAEGLEMLLRRIIREESGLTPATPAAKWRGGNLVLRPGREGMQESSWPIETFFHKVVMLRNRLRVLEQQINGAEIPDELKVKLQGYITGCYGTLTSFNVLFAEEEDRFHGAGK